MCEGTRLSCCKLQADDAMDVIAARRQDRAYAKVTLHVFADQLISLWHLKSSWQCTLQVHADVIPVSHGVGLNMRHATLLAISHHMLHPLTSHLEQPANMHQLVISIRRSPGSQQPMLMQWLPRAETPSCAL